jgi:hypothetical protein
MLPLAPAVCFVTNLGRHHCDDADDLCLRCKPMRVELVGRPGK